MSARVWALSDVRGMLAIILVKLAIIVVKHPLQLFDRYGHNRTSINLNKEVGGCQIIQPI